MAHNFTETDGGSTHDHPASGLETIVVDADDVIEAMRRTNRDQDQRRSHVLRLHPPFEGEVRAKPHVSEDQTYYPPEMDPKPIHIGPAAVLVGHSEGSRHPDWHNDWGFPDRGTEKALFRDEHDAKGPAGEYRKLTDEEEEKWDEWWETVVEIWEDRVRHALKSTDELTLTSQHPDVGETTVGVRVEEDA